MSSDSDQQKILQPTRAMVAFMAVVLVVTGVGSWRILLGVRSGNTAGQRDRGAYGVLEKPKVIPVTADAARCEELGVGLRPIDGFAYYLVDPPSDGRGPTSISMINRSQAILVEIDRFGEAETPWPPEPIDFGLTVSVNRDSDRQDGKTELGVGPLPDFRLQVQSMLYDQTSVIWASPRKSPTWPLRLHLGKCELGGRTVLIKVYEMQARDPEPDYGQGPIAEIASALFPL